jgi:hypothetical protein
MSSIRIVMATAWCLVAASAATAATPDERVPRLESRGAALNPLKNLSSAIETLSAQVLPSVVQVVVTAYTAQDAGNGGSDPASSSTPTATSSPTHTSWPTRGACKSCCRRDARDE